MVQQSYLEMSELQVELSPGFAKADASNLPTISGATVLGFITKLHKDKTYAAALDRWVGRKLYCPL